MIEVVDITKQFRRYASYDNQNDKVKKKRKNKLVEFNAVDHISLNANDGEILGILGPNGAGKTTLLRMMGKLMNPTEGKTVIKDKMDNVIEDDYEIKKRIGYLSANTKLYHRFSTRESLRLFGDIYGMDKSEIDERIDSICTVLKMESFIDNRIDRLSTGQLQRASIARCLIHDPDIYIFDEPTLGLDIISSKAIIDFMKSEKERGKTIIYSTHYMEEAQYLCDKIAMIHKGRVVCYGEPKELMNKYGVDNLRDTFQKIIDMSEGKEETKNEQTNC